MAQTEHSNILQNVGMLLGVFLDARGQTAPNRVDQKHAFAVWVVNPEKSRDLQKLVEEFSGYFSAEETTLVALLASAEKLRAEARDRHYAEVIAQSRAGMLNRIGV